MIMHDSADQILQRSQHFMSFVPRACCALRRPAPAKAAGYLARPRIHGKDALEIRRHPLRPRHGRWPACPRSRERYREIRCSSRGRPHGDFVGRVEDRRREPARMQAVLRQRQAGKTLEVGRFERQLLASAQDRASAKAKRCAAARQARARSACACRALKDGRASNRRNRTQDNARCDCG